MAAWFGKALLALGLAVYGWTMMLVELYLRAGHVPEGPDRGLVQFRRAIMGRACVGLGAATVVAAVVLAILGRQRRLPAGLALALAAAWVVCLAAIWPI